MDKKKEETRVSVSEKTRLNNADETHLSGTLRKDMGTGSLTRVSPLLTGQFSEDPSSVAPDDAVTEIVQGDLMGDTMMDDEAPYPDDSGEQNPERTTALFGISDIHHKLENELANIPDNYEEELEPNQMSALIKTFFPSRSDEERLRINRHFLKDAEPFRLEKFIGDLKAVPAPLQTGLASLDHHVIIPGDSLTLITSLPRHGKTCFLLNLLLNLCRRNPDQRFLYYSYEEPRNELALRLINMCGTRQFPRKTPVFSNMEHWRRELRNLTQREVLEKSETEAEYRGLKTFLELTGRIQLVDSGHRLPDLADSIRSFKKTFPVGAVFIDSLARLQPGADSGGMVRAEQIREIVFQLRLLAYEIKTPVILSVPIAASTAGVPEYDALISETLSLQGSPDQFADLTLGLQNYARSRFLGSNLTPGFTSAFHGEPLTHAVPMPESIKDMMNKTVMLVKVITGKRGGEPDIELIFHKQLLTLGDI